MTTLTNQLFDLYLKKGYAGNKKKIAELRLKLIQLKKKEYESRIIRHVCK